MHVPLGSKMREAKVWPVAVGGMGAPGGLPQHSPAAAAAVSGARVGAVGAAVDDGTARTWLAATRPSYIRAAGASCEAQRRETPAFGLLS